MFIDLRLGALHEPLSGRSFGGADCTLRVNARAAVLHRHGIQRGDRVFLHYGNKAEFFFDMLALWRLGACAVTVDPRFTAFEISKLAQALAPSFSVWDGSPDPESAAALQSLGTTLLDASEHGDAPIPEAAAGLPRLDDDALIMLTSGTTGDPKGVVHTHRSLRARWASQRDRLGVDKYARTLCLLPTNFAWGLVGNCLYPWLSGQELFLLPAFRSDVVLQLGKYCDELGITHLPTVPTIWRVALRTAAPPKARSLQRVTCGTSPLPAALWRDIGAWSGAADVMNIYGITETGWLAGASTTDVAPEDGLIGSPWATVVKVLEAGTDDPLEGQQCNVGDAGEVWVQTPALMREYFRRDDFTRQVVKSGWYATGDIGCLDERGLLYLRGRDKEIINVGGVKVYPADVDAVVGRCEGVAEACCFAVEDALQGDAVSIALVMPERSDEMLERVYRFTARHLARHQMPRRWFLVDEIPRTPRGKVNRDKVAEACAGLQPVDTRSIERGVRATAAEKR